MVYLVCFGISVFFAHLAKKTENRKRFIFWSILSILVTVLLAGLRDISIGIDTSNYYDNSWKTAVGSSSFWRFMVLYHRAYRAKEYLFAILIGLIAKTTRNYHVFLFAVHLIIVGGFYIGAFRFRKHADPVFSLLLFYLLYYNHSLNVFRQYMAMSILFAAAADLEEGRHGRYFFFVIVAFFFHNTSILGILPLILYRLVYPSERLSRVSFSKRILIYCLIVIAVCAFLPMARLLINLGILSTKYLFYLESDSTNTYFTARLMILAEIVGMLIFVKAFRSNNEKADFFLISFFSFAVLYQLASLIPYGKRLPAYFSFLNIIALGMLARSPSMKSNRTLVRLLEFSAVFAYWLFLFAYYNTSKTMPYILGV